MTDDNNFHQCSVVVKKNLHGRGIYHFAYLPEALSKQLHFWHVEKQGGFRSLRVMVSVGESTWRSSIFFKDGKNYLLLLNKKIIKAESLIAGKKIKLTIEVL